MNLLGYGYGEDDRGRGDWYDTMQVCLNGHKITEYAQSQPGSRRHHCTDCGSATILACPGCQVAIRGHRHIEGVFSVYKVPVPTYCPDCGKAFPWQAARFSNLVEVLREAGISDADVEMIAPALPDIAQQTPKTDSAALRIRRIMNTVQDPFFRDVIVRALTGFACETAKETMGITATKER